MGGNKGGKGGYGRGTRAQQPRLGGPPPQGRGGYVAPSPRTQHAPQQSPGRQNMPVARQSGYAPRPQPHLQQPLPRAQPYQRPQGRGQPQSQPHPQHIPRVQPVPGPGRSAADARPMVRPDHPFNMHHRGVVDHMLRPTARRVNHVHPCLTHSTAHWVTIPVESCPLLQHVPLEVEASLDAAVVAPEECVAEITPRVNARALLCAGLMPPDDASTPHTQRRHVLSRIPLVMRDPTQPGEGYGLYGGKTDAATDEDIANFLATKMEEETGLQLGPVTWYKLLELHYHEGSGLLPTVVFIPATWDVEKLHVRPCVREQTVEREELVEVELSRDGMTDEEYQEAKAAAQLEKKVVVEQKRVTVSVPKRVTLHEALQRDMSKTVMDEYECSMAVDALDEFIKRDMASIMATALRAKAKACLAATAEREQEAAARAEAKRKRDEEYQARRRACQVQLEELRARWEVEDQGKTDDEKEEMQAERRLQEQQIMEKSKAQEEAAQHATVDVVGTATTGSADAKYKTVVQVNQRDYDAFEYFDRSMHQNDLRACGFLPRQRVESLLLNTDHEAKLCLKEVNDILNPITKLTNLGYKAICSHETKVEIAPEPEPQPEPEAEAAPEADAAMADGETKADDGDDKPMEEEPAAAAAEEDVAPEEHDAPAAVDGDTA